MKRKLALFGIAAAIIAVAAIASRQQSSSIPVLERALKAKDTTPPVAVLIELGVKDAKPSDWSGAAKVAGAKVVSRQGYRFRKDDRLIEPNGWQAKSRYSIRAPNNPIIRRIEGVASVGVVLHLSDIQKHASLTVAVKDIDAPAAKVALGKVLAGETIELWDGFAVVRRVSMASPIATGPTEDDHPAADYGPDGTLWTAYISYTLRDPNRSIEQPRYQEQLKSFKEDLYHPNYAEQLFVRPYKNGKWGQAIAITDAQQDLARCAIAVTNDNTVWTVYSAHRDGNFDLYACPLQAGAKKLTAVRGKEVRLTTNAGPDLTPVACVDASGKIWVAYQSWNKDRPARIGVVKFADGKWSSPKIIPQGNEHDGNCWHPAIAAAGNGNVAVAYDVYRGQYDVQVAIFDGSPRVWQPEILPDPHFQARPSLTYDSDGKLWIAYELGPEKWGKDYGALDSKDGNPLYNTRTVQVVCLDDERNQFLPAAKLPSLNVSAPQLPFDAIKTNKFERRSRWAYPKIGLDGKGRVWLTYRRNYGSRYTSHPGAVWRTYARRLNGDAWTEEMEVHHSDGLLDHRPVLLPHVSGGLLIIHNTDGRFTSPETLNNDVYLSFVDVQRDYPAPELLPAFAKAGKVPDYVLQEREAVKNIRSYRIKAGGKTYQLLRGEYHRHTEISWDGEPDGSLEDMFRYAIDAASFDWIGNGDHDNGAGREYPWWLTQKFTDAYHVAGVFTPMFTYERSVSYPHGHRNVMFAKRGVMTLPRLAPPKDGKRYHGRVHPDDTKMLYRYLNEMDGICAVHTSATGMGTDWRDNDPKAEPIVEIYQGDRMSYEHPGAPRAGYDPQSGKFPANVGGWRPLGFVDNALARKGYKLGFQSSSDHWSTHISYFTVIAEEHSRDGILAAVKKRHCYGATDNIIVDLRSGENIQGDELTTNGAPSLQFTVIGNGPIAKIDVMKDSEAVATFEPKGSKYQGDWADAKADGNLHYYYIRVVQADGEVAWASPLWIRKSQ